MHMVIDLPQPVEARIEEEAQKAGVSPIELVTGVVLEKFAPAPLNPEEQKLLNASSIALLQQWLDESETQSPEEVCQAEEEARQFKRALNIPRKEVGARLLFPEVEDAE